MPSAYVVVQLVLGKDQGILYQVRLMIRGDVIGARAKLSKGLGMPGKDRIFTVSTLFRFVVSSSFFAVGEERSLGFGRVLSLLLNSLEWKRL